MGRHKDPAVLFYTADFLTGTITMTNEQVGIYIRLLCLQHQKGFLTEKDILFFCKDRDEDIFSKFIRDENGNYYNVRLREEAEKRKRYTESRRLARLKKEDDNVRFFLLKDTNSENIKIATSKNPLTKYNEIRNRENGHVLLWYSDPIPRRFEAQIYEKFSKKRVSGKWFSLTKSDISAIKKEIESFYSFAGKTDGIKTKEEENINGTYVPRMENENENISFFYYTKSMLDKRKLDKKISSNSNFSKKLFEDFEIFWKNYPKRVKKAKAKKEWEGKKVDLKIVLDALERQKREKERLRSCGKFCPEWPDPERWIKYERWNDEVVHEAQQQSPYEFCPRCKRETLKDQYIEENGQKYCPKCYHEGGRKHDLQILQERIFSRGKNEKGETLD